MHTPSRVRSFLRETGKWGIVSIFTTISGFAGSVWLYIFGHSIPAYWFILIAAVCFCVGAFKAWDKKTTELEEVQAKNKRPGLKVCVRAVQMQSL